MSRGRTAPAPALDTVPIGRFSRGNDEHHLTTVLLIGHVGTESGEPNVRERGGEPAFLSSGCVRLMPAKVWNSPPEEFVTMLPKIGSGDCCQITQRVAEADLRPVGTSASIPAL